MSQYLGSRLLQLIPLAFIVTLLIFTIFHVLPGDAAAIFASEGASPETVELIRSRLGLDRPLHVQYLDWVLNLLRGDMGNSFLDGRPVLPVLASRFPATLYLAVASMLVTILIGVPAGVISAVKQNTTWDRLTRVVSLIGLSMPTFWFGLILMLVFSYHLKWLPLGGYGSWKHVILPALALGTTLAATVMRLTRSSVLEVAKEDFVRTARAKGLAEPKVVYKHVLRNALIPVITITGLQTGALLGGTVVIETVFRWPGVGFLLYDRMINRDVPFVMGSLFVFAVLLGLINLITDLSYALVDPRIRYS